MDTAVASSIRRDETVPVALLLAFAGGYLDAYTWIIHGVMANAQTANLVLLWVYGVDRRMDESASLRPTDRCIRGRHRGRGMAAPRGAEGGPARSAR